MSRTRILGVLAATASLYLARSGHADPISDYQASPQLYLRSATVAYGNATTSVAGIDVTKPAGALAWTLNAQQLGLPYNVPVTLTLSQQNGSVLIYTVNQAVSPAIDVTGNGDLLEALSGSFTMVASAIPGDENSSGDVLLTAMPFVSFVNATGTWGTVTIPVVEASFIGGYTPVSLSSFFVATDAEICSDTVPVPVEMTVTLNSVAPAGGQKVDLQTGAHQDVALPSYVIVPPNKNYVTFYATIAPNYVGNVPLTASANGAFADVYLEVDTNADCQPSHGNNPPLIYNPNPECVACQAIAIDDYGDSVSLVNRVDTLIQNGVEATVVSLYAGVGAQAMTARAMSDGGFITGTVEINNVVSPYRANFRHMPGQLTLLGTITPFAVSNSGTVVGEWYDAAIGVDLAAWDAGNGTQLIAFPRAFGEASSVATIISERMEILGTYTTTAGVTNGFRWTYGQAVTELPIVGSTSGIPVAANASGQIAANGVNAAGSPVAALIDASNNVTLLGEPRGYTNFTAKSMNKHGWIVGDAQSTGGTLSVDRAFVWIPGTGFEPLSGWSTQMPVVTDCSHITDDGTVVVYGTNAAGVTNYFTLKL